MEQWKWGRRKQNSLSGDISVIQNSLCAWLDAKHPHAWTAVIDQPLSKTATIFIRPAMPAHKRPSWVNRTWQLLILLQRRRVWTGSLDTYLRFQLLHPAICVQFYPNCTQPKETQEKLGFVIWGNLTKEGLHLLWLWGSHHLSWVKTLQCSCFGVTHAPVGSLSTMMCLGSTATLGFPTANW